MSFKIGSRLRVCLLIVGCVLAESAARVAATYLSFNEGDPCVDQRTGTAGVCTHLWSCPSAAHDLWARLIPTTCAFNGIWTVVCCRPEGTAQVKPFEHLDSSTAAERATPPPQPITKTTKKPARRISEIKCEQYNPRVYAVILGEPAELDEFPHMAALGWRTWNGSISFKCGGTLISERFVLTAAHCLAVPRDPGLVDLAPAIVRLGVINITDSLLAAAKGLLDVPIKTHIPHPKYKPPAKYYDVALLELEQDVLLDRSHKPTCLWTREDFEDHKEAIITGWGTTTNRGRQNSPILMKANVDILDSRLCDKLLESARSRNWVGFQDHQLCAGSLAGGKDTCQGDSGGPLQVMTQRYPWKYYAVIGVTSFGRECGLKNQPGVYTRVSSFIDWIEPIVWPANI